MVIAEGVRLAKTISSFSRFAMRRRFDDGPRACQRAEKPFQIRGVEMTSKSVVDTRLTADQSACAAPFSVNWPSSFRGNS
jgi:hypothetical protein